MTDPDLSKVDPRAVVLDLILAYAPTIGKIGTATVIDGTLIFRTKNHREENVMLNVKVHLDGEPSRGSPPRWVLFKLGPTVWKVSPSVLDEKIHCYLTIVGVPDPAPWEAMGSRA